MRLHRRPILAAAVVLLAAPTARAELIVKTDGSVMEGSVVARDSQGLTVKNGTDTQPVKIPANTVNRVIVVDEKGAELAEAAGIQTPAKRQPARWQVPKEPAAPMISSGPHGNTYYVIPLHGAVGETYVAYALEQSLADALKRKPTVVVLDIDSPGGKVAEAEEMMKILHRYNKDLRIVALADQDLSASAITSLSVHEIYMKPTGTIGAATSFIPDVTLSATVEEKMQSAWRAVARNSAEEGGHEPLLAEAMIDTSRELHLETVGGKKAVKEGPGDRVLSQKGKILTLTSHEAVECGLAAGVAEDFEDLGKQLKMPGWKECPGLGTVLAAYLPDRWQALESQEKQLETTIRAHMAEAERNVPSDQMTLQRAITGPMMPGIPTVPSIPTAPGRFGPTGPRGPVPGGGGFGGRGFGGAGGLGQNPRIVEQVVVDSPEARAKWFAKSLATVIALQKVEADIDDGVALSQAFGETDTDEIKDAQAVIGAIRAEMFANRNKYIGQSGGPSPAPPDIAGRRQVQPAARPMAPAIADAEGLPKGTHKSELAGGGGGSPFTRIDEKGRPMIGVRYTMGKWQGKPVVRRIDPLFEKPIAGAEDAGTTIVAKDGYVVGGLVVDTSANLDGFKVQFFRLKGGKPDRDDQYSGEWQGAPGDHSHSAQLGGDGERILGIYGRQGLNQDAVGLVTTAAGG